MLRFMHSRRWVAAAVAAVIVLVLPGCTLGWARIPPGLDGDYIGCQVGADLGPGHASNIGTGGTGWFVPAPGTVQLRFVIMNSDATQPIKAGVVLGTVTQHFGVVWDGVQSTGIKDLAHSAPFQLLVWVTPAATQPIAASWWIMALDASGNEVGFTCAPSPG